jgi:hypothetical protein
METHVDAAPPHVKTMNPTELRVWWGNPSRWNTSDAAARFAVFAELIVLLQNLQRTEEIYRVTVERMLTMDAVADRLLEALAVAGALHASDSLYHETVARIDAAIRVTIE